MLSDERNASAVIVRQILRYLIYFVIGMIRCLLDVAIVFICLEAYAQAYNWQPLYSSSTIWQQESWSFEGGALAFLSASPYILFVTLALVYVEALPSFQVLGSKTVYIQCVSYDHVV